MVSLLAMGRQGGMHHEGEHQASFIGSFGTAIKGETIRPNGDGRADNAGFTGPYSYDLSDRAAFSAALTPARIYNQSDQDVYTGEFQIGFRWHFFEFDIGTVPVGLYADVWGGMLYGARSVPDEGSNFNFTQDLGMGFEAEIMDNVYWTGGYRHKHLSNGDCFNDDNSSPNDNPVYPGIAFSW
jgi:hypothetical protein